MKSRTVCHLLLSLTILLPTTTFCGQSLAQEPQSASTGDAKNGISLQTPAIEERITDQKTELPKNQNQQNLSPQRSAPKQSQPDREKRQTPQVRPVRTSAQRVPGRPSRNLDLPSTVAEAAEQPEAGDESEAEEEPEEDDGLPDYMLGVWPRELLDGGILFEAIYTGETFTKAKGGMIPNRTTNYRSNLDLVAIADTGKLGWWDRGRFFVYGQNLNGRTFSDTNSGEVQLFSNLDSTVGPGVRPNFTAVSEYWFEQYWWDDIVSFRIGKQDTNAIFALTDLGGEFVNSSFGAPPPIPMPTFPSSSLGLSTFLKLTDTATLGFGVFDGTPADGPQGVRWGFDTFGRNGYFTIYQAEFKPQLGIQDELPTTVRVGMWHHNSKDQWVEVTANPVPRVFNQNYGFFLTADQMIWKENGAADEQGFGVFGQYFTTPGNRNEVSKYFGTGLVYKGFLPGRDDDIVGVGMGRVIFGQPFRDQEAANGTLIGHDETMIETFYKYIVGPRLCLQPDLQYIARPSGQFKDALIAGMRFELVF